MALTPTRYAGVKRKPNGKFKWQYFTRLPDGSRFAPTGTCDTDVLAHEARNAAIAEVRLRIGAMESTAAPADITVEEYFRGYIARRRAGHIEESTGNNYLMVLERCRQRPGVRGILHLKMTSVRGSHIGNLILDLSERGQLRDPEKAYSFKCIIAVYDLLHQGFQRAMPEFLTYNPMAHMEKPYALESQAADEDIKFFEVEEAQRLITTARTMLGDRRYPDREAYSRIVVFWVICFDLGVRIGEAAGMMVDGIDLETGAIHLYRQLTYIHGEPGVSPRRLELKALKGKRARSKGKMLLLSPEALVEVRAHVERTKRERFDYGTGYENSGHLIVHRDGRPYTPAELYSRHRILCKHAGVPYRSPHKMRHSTATWLNAMDFPAEAIQGRLVHANRATSELYTHPTDKVKITRQVPAAAALGKAVFGEVG